MQHTCLGWCNYHVQKLVETFSLALSWKEPGFVCYLPVRVDEAGCFGMCKSSKANIVTLQVSEPELHSRALSLSHFSKNSSPFA